MPSTWWSAAGPLCLLLAPNIALCSIVIMGRSNSPTVHNFGAVQASDNRIPIGRVSNNKSRKTMFALHVGPTTSESES